MADIPEKDLEETRAALAPTLEATAAILPWVGKPRPLRFAKELNERWVAACRNLAAAWSARHHAETDSVRPAVFALYGVALESADTDCLRLGEALASATDGLEGTPPARRIAALSATIECFDEASGLEHALFAERARHFAERLEGCLSPGGQAVERSPVLDRLFASEARERLERLRDALAALPLDAYALKIEAGELAQQAEHLELYGILHLCRELVQAIPSGIDQLENDTVRQGLLAILDQLETAIAAVDA